MVRDDSLTMVEDGDPIGLEQILANDDGVHELLSGDIVERPRHGDIAYGPDGPYYRPFANYHGPDSFTYRGDSRTGLKSDIDAVVTIEVVSDGVSYELPVDLGGGWGRSLAAGDLDGDQRDDIVVAAALAGVLAVSTASDGFVIEGGDRPFDLALADLDGDGQLDIAVAAGDDGLLLLRNRGEAALLFDAPVTLPTGYAVDLVAVDLNGDARPDLVALDQDHDAMVVRINASTPGTLAFGVATTFTTPDQPVSVATGDVDGVGGPDLIVVGYASKMLSVFSNAITAGGTVPAFAARLDRATGNKPVDVMFADLDADLRPEIVVVHEYELRLYANRGAPGTSDFITARIESPTGDMTSVVTADLDGSGPVDLVVGSDADAVRLVNHSVNGQFAFDEVEADGPATGGIEAMVRGDIDGDGRDEIIMTGSRGTYAYFE